MGKPVLEQQGQVTHVSDASLRRFAGYHMKRAFNVVQANLNFALKPFGLRMVTYSALVLIVENPGLRQAQLAEALDVEQANLVLIIDELEKRNLINRDRVPTDRRAYALIATRTGRQVCGRAVEAVGAHELEVFSEWDDKTRATVIKALGQVHCREGEAKI